MNTTSADGTVIGFETLGQGPAVVLVDGAMCYRVHGPMRPIAEALAVERTAVLYDRRGRGASGDTVPYAVEREIDDLGAVIDAVGGSAALFGISSGAALCLRTAALLGPDAVTAVLVFEPPFMPEPALAAAAAYTAELRAALAAADRDAAVAAFLRRVGTPEPTIVGARRSPGWAGMTAIAPTLSYDDQVLGDSSLPGGLVRALSVPVLGLAGGASPGFLQYGARGVAEAAVDGRFELLAGQGHDPSADVIAPVLLGFLRGVSGAETG